jgi:hypothetical protein
VEKITLSYENQEIPFSFVSYEQETLKVSVENPENFLVTSNVMLHSGGYKTELQIIKKEENVISLFLSLIGNNYLVDRRKFNRYNANFFSKVTIFVEDFINHADATIKDVSLDGFGVVFHDPSIKPSQIIKVVIDGETLNLIAKVRMVNSRETEDGVKYGVKITSIEQQNFNRLREYILPKQFARIKRLDDPSKIEVFLSYYIQSLQTV